LLNGENDVTKQDAGPPDETESEDESPKKRKKKEKVVEKFIDEEELKRIAEEKKWAEILGKAPNAASYSKLDPEKIEPLE
jgi:hypothetical protein